MSEVLAGRYVPHQAIGAGNFSSVRLADVASAYRDVEKRAPQTVALKSCPVEDAEKYAILKKEWAAFDTLRASVGITKTPDYTEASSVLLSAYDYFEEGGYATIVLELAPYGDLMTYLTRNSLTERQICRIMHQLLSALKLVHAAGYAHRDVKPHNILVVAVEPQIRTKLADFGLVKQLSSGMGLLGAQCSAADFEFRSPDVKDSMEDGMFLKRMEYEANDVYAAGMTMFCLATGKVPDKDDQFRRAKNLPPMYPELRVVSPACLELLALLLDQDPDERPTAAAALDHKWFELLETAPATEVATAEADIGALKSEGSILDGHGVEATVTGHISALPESAFNFRPPGSTELTAASPRLPPGAPAAPEATAAESGGDDDA